MYQGSENIVNKYSVIFFGIGITCARCICMHDARIQVCIYIYIDLCLYIHNTKACVHTRHYRSSSENTWTDVMMLSGLLPAF